MPGGEIYTAPTEESAEWYITFEFPTFFAGEFSEDLRLRFSKDGGVEAFANKNEALDLILLEMDDGTKRIGK